MRFASVIRKQQSNCTNCGGPLNPASTCDYCGTGARKMLARISNGAASIIKANLESMTPKELRAISNKNSKALDESCDISRPVKKINKLISQAVERGETRVRITLIYANLTKRERKNVKDYYKDQKFKIDESWFVTPDEVKDFSFYGTSHNFKKCVYIFVCW